MPKRSFDCDDPNEDGVFEGAEVPATDKTLLGKPYTVCTDNGLLGSRRFIGSFTCARDAEDYAAERAFSARSFATYSVYTGTPRNPGKPTGYVEKGKR